MSSSLRPRIWHPGLGTNRLVVPRPLVAALIVMMLSVAIAQRFDTCGMAGGENLRGPVRTVLSHGWQAYYDREGRLTESKARGVFGDLTLTFFHYWDSDHSRPSQQPTRIVSARYTFESYAPDASVSTYKYDSEGRVRQSIEEAFDYYAQGQVSSRRVVYEHDLAGNRSDLQGNQASWEMPAFTLQYTGTAPVEPREDVEYRHDGSVHRRDVYDQWGNRIERMTFEEDGALTARQVYWFALTFRQEYEYDEHGNWTRCELYNYLGDPPQYQGPTVIQRLITYHDDD